MFDHVKSSFMAHADFERISIPENNWRENPEESYTYKYENHVGCSYGHTLVCVNN